MQLPQTDAMKAWWMSAEHLLARFHRHGEVQRQLLRFTNAFITQVSQTAACNRAHGMEARLGECYAIVSRVYEQAVLN